MVRLLSTAVVPNISATPSTIFLSAPILLPAPILCPPQSWEIPAPRVASARLEALDLLKSSSGLLFAPFARGVVLQILLTLNAGVFQVLVVGIAIAA